MAYHEIVCLISIFFTILNVSEYFFHRIVKIITVFYSIFNVKDPLDSVIIMCDKKWYQCPNSTENERR